MMNMQQVVNEVTYAALTPWTSIKLIFCPLPTTINHSHPLPFLLHIFSSCCSVFTLHIQARHLPPSLPPSSTPTWGNILFERCLDYRKGISSPQHSASHHFLGIISLCFYILIEKAFSKWPYPPIAQSRCLPPPPTHTAQHKISLSGAKNSIYGEPIGLGISGDFL